MPMRESPHTAMKSQHSPAKKEMQYRNRPARTGVEHTREPSGWLSTNQSMGWSGSWVL